MEWRIIKPICFMVLAMIITGCASGNAELPILISPKASETVITPSVAMLTKTIIPTITRTNILFPTNTMISTSTSTPTPTPTATRSPLSTLSVTNSENYLAQLLENNAECYPPCIWGIVPGKTLSVDAIDFFKYLGWRGSIRYDVYNTGKDLRNHSLAIRTSVYPSDTNSIVEKFYLGIGGDDYTLLVKYFSFTNVLSLLGKPTRILVFVGTTPSFIEPVETSFEILLYYEVQNILIKYTGTALKIDNRYQICPAHPNAKSSTMNPLSGNVGIYAGVKGNKSTPDELVQPFWELPTYYIYSETALGVDQDQFFKIATKSSEHNCFYSEINVWRR